MSDHFEQRVGNAGQAWHRVPLDVSFRSTSAVLQAVDAVFADDASRDGVSTAIRHTAPARRAGWSRSGRPSFRKTDEISPWSTPDDLRNDATPARRLAHAIAWRISKWIGDGHKLPSADRPLRPGDIMVLVRRRTEFVDNLIRELKKRRIDVAGLDRMVLTDQLAVQDMVALGAFALMPHDDLNLAAVLKGPLIGFDEAKLFDICYRRDTTVWVAPAGSTDPACAAAYASRRCSRPC